MTGVNPYVPMGVILMYGRERERERDRERKRERQREKGEQNLAPH
jgi:hypothetical protein